MSQFLSSNELFINVKNPPVWNPKKHYFDQSIDVLDFYAEEKRKITEGVTIGGYFIHPWLYWHINFFKSPIPQEDGTEPIINPPLDDNFLYLIENYIEAEQTNKGLVLFGTRGFAKSLSMSSLITWLNSVKQNGVTSVVGGNDGDLKSMSRLLKVGFNNVHPSMAIPQLIQDWESQVELGIKEKDGFRLPHSHLSITNANAGTSNASEKGAGLSPIGFIMDEIGKFQCIKVLESALPSFRTQYGLKLVPVLSGCVCADTMVWNNKGELIKIQDLVQEGGILGYNQSLGEVSKEHISYWQPPHEKPCYRLTLKSGKTLECSDDHPILYRARNEKITINKERSRKVYFKETKDLVVGNHIAVIESVDIWSNKEMWEPRLVGQLIGDGSYSIDHSPTISGCDPEIYNYIYDNFETRTEVEYVTKDGKNYKEIVIKGICKELRNLGIYGQTKKNKRLPVDTHSYSKKSVCELIGGYFDSDGYVSVTGKNAMIGISSISEELILELQILLQKIGVHGYINKITHRATKLVSTESTAYKLTIADKRSINIFYENISFSIKYKQDRLEKCVEKLKNKKEQIDKHIKGIRFETLVNIEYIGLKPVYNLTADTTNTYIANGIVTHNTGGNNELSSDARKILYNPEAFDLLPMNWDRLERFSDPESITWERSKRSKFGTFVPGQMSYRLTTPRITKTLAEVLHVKDKDLAKIKVQTVDWPKATELIQSQIAAFKDEEHRDKHRMYYPLEVDDIFITTSTNPFPTSLIDRRIRELEDEGLIGKNVVIYNSTQGYRSEFSSKRRAEVSHGGGEADSPIVLFDEVPTEIPPKHLFVSGLDDYKLDQSDTDSLGAFYVIKRRNLEANSPAERIMASYVARPFRHADFHVTCETMLECWGAICNMEAVDTMFLQHLNFKHKAEQSLCSALSFSNSINNGNHKAATKFGTYPTGGNKAYMFNLVVDYTKEEHVMGIDEEGNQIIKHGVDFIDDIDLLKEMMTWKKGGNFDRITAFMHALAYARELDKKDIRPKDSLKDKFQHQINRVKPKLAVFGNRRPSAF